MSSRHKSQLRKARARLHEANNLIKMYKGRIAGDTDSIVNYVQGVAAFGEYTLEVLVAQHPEGRPLLVQEALVSWAVMNGLLRRTGKDRLEVTHMCDKGASSGTPPAEQN